MSSSQLSSTEKLQVKIGGMSCSFCTTTIQKAVGRMEGVHAVHVSLAHEEALIEYDPALHTPTGLRDTVRQLGYTVRDPDKVKAFDEQQAELHRARILLLWGASFTILTLGIMVLRWFGLRLPWFRPVMITFALATVFAAGWHILVMAVQSLRRGILNQHVLLEFGAFSGLVGGVVGLFNPVFPAVDFFAVATFITTYHLLSGWASLLVRTRASAAVHKLLDLQPATARLVHPDGREDEVPVAEVQPGDKVLVRPGESIPVDGVVISGTSNVDESLVSGEPIPVFKQAGGEVIDGSINQTGSLVLEVTKVGEDSFLSQVTRHIEEARAMKPGILALVDVILQWYIPAVLFLSGLAVLTWIVGAWLVTGQPDWTRAVFAALAVLVMGYPCALGMATPLAMIRGGGEAAQKGILMRSGEAFQVFKDVKRIMLDKTGTLTRGKPAVAKVIPLEGADEDKLMRWAASAETPSEHPLGQAIVAAALELELHLYDAQNFAALPGRGVTAVVGGKSVQAGRLDWLAGTAVVKPEVAALAEDHAAQANTIVGVVVDGLLKGLIAIADSVKPDAIQAINQLRAAGLIPVMLTGDNPHTASAVATEVGIDEVYAGLLPGEKAEKVRAFQRQGLRVAMVGDGINDAPALMQADVGIAIGAGTDIAIEAADVVLVGERLTALNDAYYVGRASYRKTVQNLWLAFAFNGIGVPLAITGLVSPVWAMFAMIASVSTVLLNSFGGRLFPRETQRARATTSVHLNIPTIHCEGCLETIQTALKSNPKVKAVDGDVISKTVTVIFDNEGFNEDEIQRMITDAGHLVGWEG